VVQEWCRGGAGGAGTVTPPHEVQKQWFLIQELNRAPQFLI